MSGGEAQTGDSVLPATRIVAVLLVPFLVAAAVLLFVFPARTGELFAWQIDAPMSAYLLASAYVGGIWFFVRVARERHWHRVKAGFPAVTVFAAALLVATLSHLDRFSANISFWTWLTLYITTPFAVAILAWLQRDPSRTLDRVDTRIPAPLRAGVIVVGTIALALGVVLFVAPQLLIPVWAWPLTPLTAQVTGAVLSLTGVVGWQMLREDRWSAFRILFQSQLLSIAAILVSLVLARHDILWDRPAAYGFVGLVLAAAAGYGALAIAMERRARVGAASVRGG